MNSIPVKFHAYGKGQPTLPLPLTEPDWAAAPPAELVPFAHASGYGMDLIYPFETECQVVAQNGTLHFEWDYEKEPIDVPTGGEFRAFSPVEASQYYLINTRVDLYPPPGYVLRTEPHPRYFTDSTGTVPLSMVGHLQNEWYPRLLFVVFRTPPPGRRHIFRKGEPFARVLFVPQQMKPAVTMSVPPTPAGQGGPLILGHQPIRMANAAWGGAPQKMEDGSEPQPWHCLPFVEASTYGVELLYPRHAEGRVTNNDGTLRIEGIGLAAGPIAGFYQLQARVALQPPAAHALRLLPHPRYFTDSTGAVPLPLISHMPGELCTSVAALVFRAPAPGQEHVFRPGDPIAQLIFVPDALAYELVPMGQEEEMRRRALESAIESSKLDVADHIWHNAAGIPFNNHYKLLARAFARAGLDGVEEVVNHAIRTRDQVLAQAKNSQDFIAIGVKRLREQKYDQAREIFMQVLDREPSNARAHSLLGVCLAAVGNAKNALTALKEAVALQPGTVNFQVNLAEFLRRRGRFEEAAATFRTALGLAPGDSEILGALAATLHEQGQVDEAISLYRASLAGNRPLPQAHFGLGKLLAAKGERSEARACFEKALALAPNFRQARQALEELG